MNISLSEQVRVFPQGEVLFREGSAATHLWLIKSGAVLCVKNSKERLIPVQHAGPRAIVGEEGVLTGSPHAYSAVTLEEVEAVEVPAQLLQGVLGSAPHWLRHLLRTLGERITETTGAVAEHRIISTELSGGRELAPEEEHRIRKLLDQ